MNKSYNRFERAHEIMAELTQAPLPLEPTELANISDRELKFLKGNVELMVSWLGSLGCLIYHDDEVIWEISEEEQKRQDK